MTESVTFAEVVETFALLDDWDERYRYLIDLGRALTGMPEAEKTPANKVDGCVSQVWVSIQPDDAQPGVLKLAADSDAHIVKGLAALLLLLYRGKTGAEILALDARAALGALDLEGHLSPSRSNGLFSMVKRIRQIAAARG